MVSLESPQIWGGKNHSGGGVARMKLMQLETGLPYVTISKWMHKSVLYSEQEKGENRRADLMHPDLRLEKNRKASWARFSDSPALVLICHLYELSKHRNGSGIPNILGKILCSETVSHPQQDNWHFGADNIHYGSHLMHFWHCLLYFWFLAYQPQSPTMTIEKKMSLDIAKLSCLD